MNSIKLIYFSPTHTTETILRAIAAGTGIGTISESNITYDSLEDMGELRQSDLVLMGVPVYGGRVPEIVLSRIGKLRGDGIPAALIAVYGNRAFEDALLELKNIATDKGFRVISAASFIGEHSYATEEYPIAVGRPDENDLRIAFEYGKKLSLLNSLENEQRSPDIPGNYPYRGRMPDSGVTPETDPEICTLCLDCISVCPAESIDESDPRITDSESCIRCSACIKICGFGARQFKNERMLEKIAWLADKCRPRREPEIFFPESGI